MNFVNREKEMETLEREYKKENRNKRLGYTF